MEIVNHPRRLWATNQIIVDLKCEHCGATQNNLKLKDNKYTMQRYIPGMFCLNCQKDSHGNKPLDKVVKLNEKD